MERASPAVSRFPPNRPVRRRSPVSGVRAIVRSHGEPLHLCMLSEPTPELLALQEAVVGRYSIERELGRGGMGIVFLARDVALERPVAIKLLPLPLAGDERMRARFVREAKTAARLSHPNIVPIHSVEEHADVVFFVMGFVDGETLAARVRRGGPLDARDGSRLIQELAWALAYAHSAGVIHRDVKPDNVMIERASGRAMLTDFGIAHAADGRSSTALGEIVGTVQFVSPEQAAGTEVDGRSDLYSLGVTAFFALTGRLPFEATTAAGLLHMHLTQVPPPVATARGSLPPKLCAAIDRCLDKDPAVRFATGEQLAEAIADARGAESQAAPPVRAFLRDRTRTGNELALLFFAAQYLGGFSHMPFGKIALPLGLLGVASVARLVQTARRLLKVGYGFDDVRVALAADAVVRREELNLAHLTPADEARLQKAAGKRAAGVALMIAGALTVGPALSRANNALLLLGAPMFLVGALLLRAAGPMPTRRQPQQLLSRWFDQLWQGRLGKWFFTFAAPSRRSAAVAPPATVGMPTELLLARSAEDLLDALPAPVRAQLEGRRNVIERLRSQIATLREREERLTAAIAQAGESPAATTASGTSGASPALIERRAELTNDLEQSRRDAAARRASAVAALENIRLQFLRLRAGLGSPTDLTADLEAAGEIERQIDAMIEVHEITA